MKLRGGMFLLIAIWGMILISANVLQVKAGSAESMLLLPNTTHWLGTDSLGRDLFLRLIIGSKNTLLVSLGAMLMSLVISLLVGWLMTTHRYLSTILGAIVGAFQVMPNLIWVIFFAAILKNTLALNSVSKVILLLSLCNWMGGAVLVANQIRQIRVKEFIKAAEAVGANAWQILWRHIWPNIRLAILTHGLFLFSSMVIQESSISFLGMGLESPQESWGTIMLEGWRSLTIAPHLVLAPTLFILLANWSLQYLLENTNTFKENFRSLPQY